MGRLTYVQLNPEKYALQSMLKTRCFASKISVFDKNVDDQQERQM